MEVNHMNSPESNLLEKRKSLLLGCLMAVAFLLYANTLLNKFVYDDHAQVEESSYVHSFKYVGKIFTSTVWSFQGPEGQSNYYRPLMMFSYLLGNKVFQSFPFGFHLINLFFNCAVVWLVFTVGATLYREEWVAFVAAVIFAFHPIHSEVVAWIAALTELQLAFFYLAAFLFFLRLGEEANHKRLRTYILLYGSFLGALLSKEQAITLPVMATVYEHFVRPDRESTTLTHKLQRYAGLWVVAGLYLLFRVVVLRGFAPVAQRPDLTIAQLCMAGMALFGQYMVKLFWPHPLLGFYAFQKSSSFTEPRVIAGAAVFLIVCALLALLWMRARPYAFALFWILLTIAPVLNVRWMAASAFAERYLYLPSFGFCILLAAAVVRLANRVADIRWARWVGATAAFGILAASSAVIAARNRDWYDDTTYFTSTIATEPHASYMRTTLGTLAWQRNDRAEAERQWQLSLVDKPDNAVSLANLGMAKIEQQQLTEAEAFLRKAIEIRSRYAAPHLHLGRIYEMRSQKAEAEREYLRAVELFPLNVENRNRLGKFYFDAGRLLEAEAQYRGSLEGSPNSEAYDGLGDIAVIQGLISRAAEDWNAALQLSPFDEHAMLGLARIYYASNRPAEAEKLYRAVLVVDMKNAEALAAMHELKPDEFPATQR
jgi:tetratricopeptide (TPR) repeat protein